MTLRALTILPPWGSLIAAGLKPYEFRRRRPPRALIGHRIVIHQGKTWDDELAQIMMFGRRAELYGALRTRVAPAPAENAGRFLRRAWTDETAALPRGAGIGTAVLGAPIRAIDLWSTLAVPPDEIDPEVWAWPMTEVELWTIPLPARGAQGFWPWRPLEICAAPTLSPAGDVT